MSHRRYKRSQLSPNDKLRLEFRLKSFKIVENAESHLNHHLSGLFGVSSLAWRGHLCWGFATIDQLNSRSRVNSEKLIGFDTSAGNPVKEIVFKLNLPDHRILKDGGEGTWIQLTHIFIAPCSYPNDKYKDNMKAQIGKCNMRIDPTNTQKEATYEVVLDTHTLSPCYKAFLITADVFEIYMYQFWFTISKIKDSLSYQFKLDNKMFRISVEIFHEFGEPLLLSPTDVFLGKLQVLTNLEFQELKSCGTYRTFSTGATIPKKARKGTKAATVPKKKDSFTTDDKIITNDPDVALELGKSISKSEAKEQEEARRVHKIHERLVTGVIIRDTTSVLMKQNPESSMKLKGIELISDATQLEIDT
ncbi:retrovirus-related pol polyprotein from transposon TNT 1-94 [Tanacetum coccineum]